MAGKGKAGKLYYEGPRWPGMDAWRLKAIYKLGLAGRRGKSAKLPDGAVRDYLLNNHFIMKDATGTQYMLTNRGLFVFKIIKHGSLQSILKPAKQQHQYSAGLPERKEQIKHWAWSIRYLRLKP
jgi:hypothetical protein